MTIYRCNQCGSISETQLPQNTDALCDNCANEVKIYDTVFYVQSLLQRYFAQSKELKQLQENYKILDEKLKQQSTISLEEIELKPITQKTEKIPTQKPQLPNEITQKIKAIFLEKPNIKISALSAEINKVLPNFNQTQYGFKKKFSDFIRQCDFLVIKGEQHNMIVSLKKSSENNNKPQKNKKTTKINETDLFANKEQHENIKQYLNSRNLSVSFDYSAVDMSGYFDEAAELIGDNFNLLEKYLKQMRYLYTNNKIGLTIDCVNLSQQEGQKLQKIFKQLFDYTMLTKYIYQTAEKKIRVSLNMAEPIKKFFMGGWLEWFATVKLIKEAHSKEKTFSIARSVIVQHENGDKNEFDVVFMPDNKTPLFIECKSGEFRQDLDKFIRICKKINIPTKNWIVLASEIDKQQADAFEKMYPVRFCDLTHFLEKVKPLI